MSLNPMKLVVALLFLASCTPEVESSGLVYVRTMGVRGFSLQAGSSGSLYVELSAPAPTDMVLELQSGYPALLPLPPTVDVPVNARTVDIPVTPAPFYHYATVTWSVTVSGTSTGSSARIAPTPYPAQSAPFTIPCSGFAIERNASLAETSFQLRSEQAIQAMMSNCPSCSGTIGANPGTEYLSVPAALARCQQAFSTPQLLPASSITVTTSTDPNTGYVKFKAAETLNCTGGPYAGWLSTFTTTPPDGTASWRYVYAGHEVPAQVCLTQPAPSGGVNVVLSTRNGAGVISLPGNVTLAAGTSCTSFTIRTSTPPGSALTVSIRADLNGYALFSGFTVYR